MANLKDRLERLERRAGGRGRAELDTGIAELLAQLTDDELVALKSLADSVLADGSVDVADAEVVNAGVARVKSEVSERAGVAVRALEAIWHQCTVG